MQMALTVTRYTDCTRHYLCSQCRTVLRYTHKRNYTYALRKGAAFAVPVFAEITTAERLHVQTPCTLCRICPKSDIKCGQDEQKLIYSPKHRVDLTALTLTTELLEGTT
jgi:hypothetical protein